MIGSECVARLGGGVDRTNPRFQWCPLARGLEHRESRRQLGGEQADLRIILRRCYARGEFSGEVHEQGSDLLMPRS